MSNLASDLQESASTINTMDIGVTALCEKSDAPPGTTIKIITKTGSITDAQMPIGAFKLHIEPTVKGEAMSTLSGEFHQQYRSLRHEHEKKSSNCKDTDSLREEWAQSVAMLLAEQVNSDGEPLYDVEMIDYVTETGQITRIDDLSFLQAATELKFRDPATIWARHAAMDAPAGVGVDLVASYHAPDATKGQEDYFQLLIEPSVKGTKMRPFDDDFLSAYNDIKTAIRTLMHHCGDSDLARQSFATSMASLTSKQGTSLGAQSYIVETLSYKSLAGGMVQMRPGSDGVFHVAEDSGQIRLRVMMIQTDV